MSGTGGTPGPGYAATQPDTSNVVGDPDGADVGTSKPTASRASNSDTSAPYGGSRASEPGSPASTQPDTSGTNSANQPSNFHPVSTAMSGTPDTLNPGVVGAGHANPAYRAPSGVVPGTTRDTTLTDVQPGGSATNPVPSSHTVTNVETANIGAAGTTTGAAPAAPGSAPTVLAGPRFVQVTWAAVANPSGDPVREYVIENDRGGRFFAGANATTKRVEFLDPSQPYRFRVAARNKGGIGPFSAWSTAVRPYNPDATDVLKPGGLTADNIANPIYKPDGSFVPGTGGTNNAPALGAITPGAADSKTVTVNWTAPTVGAAPTSYVIKASDGTQTTAAAGATSKAVVFEEAGASVTFTVQAINAKGAGVVSNPSAAVTVP